MCKFPHIVQARKLRLALFSVYQMSVLEMESTGQGTPQGVVLALVGSVIDDPSKEQEGIRTLRMYNLASLVSLAKWAIAQKVSRPSNACAHEF